ncbi:right-handed parallel beta-helix repeat-containing protein [Persicitalea jodogahamensis]|uniref:right-handed parallel beta-helix repeat-containing protein n=1 Tax=Persicitalea jodogahamensis TaxID=402147 RepID=UPI001E6480B9|nr:right-handed parallel beta-helix repeat-containing protein [Persicitalea jodogahamensis]
MTSCAKNLVRTKTYYISNQTEFDKYSGTEFSAGSTVLFAQGAEFEGQFVVKGSGSAENPNLIAAYNPTNKTILREWTENKPVINGLGKTEAPIYLYNGQYWEINNLEVTNTNGSDEDQGLLKGIYIVAEGKGTVNNLTIKNCYIHDVNGKVGGKLRGGIHVHVLGNKVKTKFNQLLIENNVVRDVGGVGIGNQSSWGAISTETYFPWTEFVIRGNFIERTGRNSIIVRYALNPVVEYNISAESSRFDTGHSIFNFNTVGCIVQYNEAYGNTGNADEIDHGGFDADYNSTGTVIQYNYSHDNNWFCGIMRRGINSDVTIRYNISQNELMGAYLYGFPAERGLKDVKIYNNVHYFGKGKGNRVFVSGGKVRNPIETAFKNNIFYFEDAAEWGFEPESSCVFENNLFYNLPQKGDNGLTANPLFVNPGKVGAHVNMRDPELFDGYRLQGKSPAIDAGTRIQRNGGKDFSGKPLYKKLPDIGAFENE